jgi:hypothetical protein
MRDSNPVGREIVEFAGRSGSASCPDSLERCSETDIWVGYIFLATGAYSLDRLFA